MGQVPNNDILIVGCGRMATHWGFYLKSLGISFNQWHRGLEVDFPNASPFSFIFLALPDDSIASFYEKNLRNFKGTTVHFSGSFYHQKIVGCHPLCSFGPKLYEPRFYRNIPLVFDDPSFAKNFITTGTNTNTNTNTNTRTGKANFNSQQIQSLWNQLPNPTYFIKPEKKALYHSLCVLSANLPQMIWQECSKQADDLGLPKNILSSLLEKTFSNFIQNPEACLTGPLARGDQSTLQRGLESLASNPLLPFYRDAIALADIQKDNIKKDRIQSSRLQNREMQKSGSPKLTPIKHPKNFEDMSALQYL